MSKDLIVATKAAKHFQEVGELAALAKRLRDS